MRRRTDQLHPKRAPKYRASSTLSPKSMLKLFRKCWTRETSFDPLRWSPRNPAWGQCAVTALVVQDLLGGELLCCEVDGTRHYWNLLPSNRALDLTRHQFGNRFGLRPPGTEDREHVLSFPKTRRRYEVLRNLVYSKIQARGLSQQLDTSK